MRASLSAMQYIRENRSETAQLIAREFGMDQEVAGLAYRQLLELLSPPCPIFQWNTRTSWPIGAGHPCIGCTEPNFWDTMSPFYERLPDVGGFGVEHRVDLIGAALAAGAAAGVSAHAIATGVHQVRERRRARELPVLPGPQSPADGPDVRERGE
jgi:hypothetical protein